MEEILIPRNHIVPMFAAFPTRISLTKLQLLHINLLSIPVQTHNLSSLHTILSTGSPLKPTSFDYVYSSIKEDVLLGSISGKLWFAQFRKLACR